MTEQDRRFLAASLAEDGMPIAAGRPASRSHRAPSTEPAVENAGIVEVSISFTSVPIVRPARPIIQAGSPGLAVVG